MYSWHFLYCISLELCLCTDINSKWHVFNFLWTEKNDIPSRLSNATTSQNVNSVNADTNYFYIVLKWPKWPWCLNDKLEEDHDAHVFITLCDVIFLLYGKGNIVFFYYRLHFTRHPVYSDENVCYRRTDVNGILKSRLIYAYYEFVCIMCYMYERHTRTREYYLWRNRVTTIIPNINYC